jgi:hypothetical protein
MKTRKKSTKLTAWRKKELELHEIEKLAKPIKNGKYENRGKDEEGRYNGDKVNSVMFPVTCRDGLLQMRFSAEEKALLVKKANKNKCLMSDLFEINGSRFRVMIRADIKNQVMSQVSDITHNNYRSVVQYVREVIIR